MTAYKIQNINNKNLYWSNKLGYCDKRSATLFMSKEGLNLPIEGRWVEIKLKSVTV